MLMKHDKQTITEDGRLMLDKAQTDQIETVWDRYQSQLPQCGYCDMGLSCRNCVMGPCRVDPFGEGPQKGVCGADADIIVARNLCRMVAAGAASHSDHGRELVEVLAGVADGTALGWPELFGRPTFWIVALAALFIPLLRFERWRYALATWVVFWGLTVLVVTLPAQRW